MHRLDPNQTAVFYKWRRSATLRAVRESALRGSKLVGSARRRGLALAALVAVAAMCRMGTAADDDRTSVSFPPMDSIGALPQLRQTPSIFTNAKLFVTQDSPFRRQATEWRRSRPRDASVMNTLASRAQAIWLGEWNENLAADVDEVMQASAAARSLPVFVIYFIPLRDCGEYAAGGAVSASYYREWTGTVARAIGNGSAAVILEPDALAGMDCLTAKQQAERIALLGEAVSLFAALPHAAVYIDAGNAKWMAADEMVRRLKMVNVSESDGFALNISNFLTTQESIAYGEEISKGVGGKHFLIDTSRNGLGPAADLAWCNPAGRALGTAPTVNTGHQLVDALLWVKRPGESDGECNGGPAAGVWWPEYALGLAQRAGY